MKRSLAAVLMAAMVALLIPAAALALDDAEVKALFDKKCALCHGKDGVAKKMGEGSANLNDPEWQAATSVDDIIKVINEGAGKMKEFQSKLSEEEIKAIAEYVKALPPPAS